MRLSNREQKCAECEFMKMYDYGNRIYYCDHENRIDEMGKLGVDYPLNTSPEYNGDSDLPSAPRLEMYQETFGGLENITEQWYKENI